MKQTVFIALIMMIALPGFSQTEEALKDSVRYNYTLKEAKITARWMNDTARYHYNQMKYYVTTILPYLDAATRLFKDIDAKANDESISKKERKRYIAEKEDVVRTEFEDKVRNLNVTQGVLLIKLIARQSNINIYQALQEFKNPVTAVKWQVWARVHGLNLDRKYHPDEEPDLENIMDELGYPLPASYAAANRE